MGSAEAGLDRRRLCAIRVRSDAAELPGRLQKSGNPTDVLLGLELKGWYLLSKEREPSYRFTATPLAASEWDLLVVVPWYLSNVLSGTPTVLEPFVSPARWAAEYRNWYWEWKRGNPKKRPQEKRGVIHPEGVTSPPPYPSGKTEMADTPVEDGGGNFGRFSRAGVMDEYIRRLLEVPVTGIAGRDWIDFFTIFTESSTRTKITEELRAVAVAVAAAEEPDESVIRAVDLVRDLLAVVGAAESEDTDDPAADPDAARTAIQHLRANLDRLVRVGADVGLGEKELRKLAGVTPTALKKLLEGDGEAADSASAPASATSPDDVSQGVPDTATENRSG